MKLLHALALALCAFAPTAWLVVLLLLLLGHGGSVRSWTGDDWLLMAGVVVLPPLVAAALLRVPPIHPVRRWAQRTTEMLNEGVPSEAIRFNHSGR